MEFRSSHLAICVTDLKRSIHFYEALGFACSAQFELLPGISAPINVLLELENVHLVAQFMQRSDGATLELLEFKSPSLTSKTARRSFGNVGFTHLSFYVDDMAAAMDMLEDHGGIALRHTATHFSSPGMKAVFCMDPDGVRIELMELTDK